MKPKMAACSSKGGETDTLNIGEPFFCNMFSEVAQERKTGSMKGRKEMKDKT